MNFEKKRQREARRKAHYQMYKEEILKNHREYYRKCYESHPEILKARATKQSKKGGKYYEKRLIYQQSGLQREKNKIRAKHSTHWRKYKGNWLTETQIHHEWIPETADYRGIALVEKDQHLHGFIDVIQILEGEITLFEERKYPF